MKLFLIFLSSFILFSTIETKSNLTLDTFFNYTSFGSLSLSPSGQHLLIHTQRPAWGSNSFENSLWLYQTVERRKKLITNQLFEGVKVQWSPSGKWFVFLLKNNSASNIFSFRHRSLAEQNIYLYSIESDEVRLIPIGNDIPIAIIWSQDDSSLYYATINLNSTDDSEWKDIIKYQSNPTSIIRHININSRNDMSPLTTDIANVPFLIDELIYNPIYEKLIFSSISFIVENIDILQIYLIDLKNVSSIIKLTKDSSYKQNLQLTMDNKRIIFKSISIGSNEGLTNLTQQRLYSIDLTNGLIERWVSNFQGSVLDYTTTSDGGVYILGQLGINVQIYSQTSPNNISTLHDGFNGSYLLISSSSVNSVAFIFSSFSKAEEAYFITDIKQLKSAEPITNENNQYDQIDLPQGQAYQWTNNEDNQTIEGILHYPPGKFQEKNLPVLVLMHGGPVDASLNYFIGNWYTWAPMAAAEGWLVFEPNYRGSTGYGDRFVNEIRYQPLTRPEKDILSGIDRLIQDGIADKTKLTIGGYSYSGILTNWLITQTNRFNTALSGAGSIEQVSFWGMTDLPVFIGDLLGGLPWTIPQIYQNQSAIYYFDQIRTPTHIVAGENDVRVPVSQNLMLARAFRYLGIPVELLLLPNEGHALSNNPWHGKIKVREEIKWLQLYGYKSNIIDKN
jgi:dipeptidyl aminopeptidase/acylaminoacyl peptidase